MQSSGTVNVAESFSRSEIVTEVKSSGCTFNEPLPDVKLQQLSHKNFSDDTMKKVKWVTKMYRDWRAYLHSCGLQKN